MQLTQPERNRSIFVGGQELAAGGEEERSKKPDTVKYQQSSRLAGCELTAFLQVTGTGVELYEHCGPSWSCSRCHFCSGWSLAGAPSSASRMKALRLFSDMQQCEDKRYWPILAYSHVFLPFKLPFASVAAGLFVGLFPLSLAQRF